MLKIFITALSCLLLFAALAQDTSVSKKSWASQSGVTGNWGGARDSLKKNGLIIEPRATFFQHNYVAGAGDNESIFSGKLELMVKFNGVKLGLKRWTLVTHLEQNFGKSLNGKGGTLIPNNIATTFPGLDGSEAFDVTSLHLVYQFGKSNVLMIGKINMVDIVGGTRFSGGRGIDALWNVNFPGPVSGITPAYMLGAISTINTKALKYTFMVYDPANYVNQIFFESPFKSGITFSGSIEKEATIWGKKGTHSFRAAFSTQDGADLYDLGDLILPTPDSVLGEKNSRWYFNYVINQPLVDYAEKGKGWGIFGMVSISDGNPNPIHIGMHVGIGGNSFFKNRSNDKWGLAMYHYSLSNSVDEFAGSLGRPLRNETGAELFYQAWLTNWLSLGGDLQLINPVLKNNPWALFLGLRTSIKF